MIEIKQQDKETKIIINEIRRWKESSMLPEHYCDYLLNLYTKGDSESVSSSRYTHLATSALTLGLTVFVIYFTEMSSLLQTAILAVFVVFLVAMAIHYSKKGISTLFLYVAAALILLFMTVHIVDACFEGKREVMIPLLYFHCSIWSIMGFRHKSLTFLIGGILAAALLTIYILI
ncbi:hypothetical protein [Rossellomorea marisflavi]|uniref:hypothetical protein n=1 Tax=Rossellomorea marisflavi TaxID=189381 RepID=UPI0011E72033|nr:hypothetical protein [Rossellomorea marisflavi]TYO73178.1 hypothetical protein DQ398_002105 [Rossellomorea marisflavi]